MASGAFLEDLGAFFNVSSGHQLCKANLFSLALVIVSRFDLNYIGLLTMTIYMIDSFSHPFTQKKDQKRAAQSSYGFGCSHRVHFDRAPI